VPRLLILGSSGFVGRHLEALVRGQSAGSLELAIPAAPYDLRDRESLAEVIRSSMADWIVHLAAQASPADAAKAPLDTYDINTMGTARLVDVLKAQNFRGRLLYVSSADVYGRVAADRLPIPENEPAQPLNPYAASKLAAEAVCREAVASADLDVVIARPFNHIGPGQDERFAIASFATQIAAISRGEAPKKLRAGNLSVERDFTDVRDIVRGYLLLLKSAPRNSIVNLASGVPRRLQDIVQQMAALAKVNLETVQDASRLRQNEMPRVTGDASFARSLGWKPTINFEQTLADIMQSHLKQPRTLTPQ
jgi:GDP-4-dehydro-6-deoxy-D-mannose reductase